MSRPKWRPANRFFMHLNLLIVGPFLPNHYCKQWNLAINEMVRRLIFQ